jgi:hypothetical protein
MSSLGRRTSRSVFAALALALAAPAARAAPPPSQPGNGGVPEPASWSLLILGFGGLGAALRRPRLQTA